MLLLPEIRRAIAEEADAIFRGAGKIGFVPEENLHVTMKFLSDVHRDDLSTAAEIMEEAAEALVPGEIELAGFGGFPNLARPRILWAGTSDPAGILAPVFDRMDRGFTALGVTRERRRYVPHVTVGRVRGSFDAVRTAERLKQAGEVWFGRQPVENVALVMSDLGRGGPPVYTVLGRFGPRG